MKKAQFNTGWKNHTLYNQHGIGNLMFADTASKNNHACLLRLTRKLVQGADVCDDIQNQSRRPEGVEIYHVSNRTICERGAEHGYIVLRLWFQEEIG